MSYWDTSALVKLYLPEPDSPQFESLALAAPVVIGMIARHEMRTVFRRREAEAAIPRGRSRGTLSAHDFRCRQRSAALAAGYR